ncbi:MAG: hypothetical protein ACE5HX_12825 [bacterium]
MLHGQTSKRKGMFFLAVSWLIARLWWSIELSRLTILRVKQKAVISRVAYSKSELPICHWVFDRNRLYCVGVNDEIDEMFIREISHIEQN